MYKYKISTEIYLKHNFPDLIYEFTIQIFEMLNDSRVSNQLVFIFKNITLDTNMKWFFYNIVILL